MICRHCLLQPLVVYFIFTALKDRRVEGAVVTAEKMHGLNLNGISFKIMNAKSAGQPHWDVVVFHVLVFWLTTDLRTFGLWGLHKRQSSTRSLRLGS